MGSIIVFLINLFFGPIWGDFFLAYRRFHETTITKKLVTRLDKQVRRTCLSAARLLTKGRASSRLGARGFLRLSLAFHWISSVCPGISRSDILNRCSCESSLTVRSNAYSRWHVQVVFWITQWTNWKTKGRGPEPIKTTKLSQQRALTEGGVEFKAANQCSDFLNQFRKSPDVYGV